MIKIGNLKKIVVFFLLFFIIDLAITQWFLKNFYYKKLAALLTQLQKEWRLYKITFPMFQC